MAAKRIRVLIVDDHPVVIDGLKRMLGSERDIEVIGSAGTGVEALSLFESAKPDITIMDIALKRDMTGIEAIQAILKRYPGARIIAFSVHTEEEKIYRAMKAGAATYLLKDALADELNTTIRGVHKGERPIPGYVGKILADYQGRPSLTGRETEVLQLMAEGLADKDIAARIMISYQTVQTHVTHILKKLGVESRTEAVAVAFRRGLVEVRRPS